MGAWVPGCKRHDGRSQEASEEAQGGLVRFVLQISILKISICEIFIDIWPPGVFPFLSCSMLLMKRSWQKLSEVNSFCILTFSSFETHSIGTIQFHLNLFWNCSSYIWHKIFGKCQLDLYLDLARTQRRWNWSWRSCRSPAPDLLSILMCCQLKSCTQAHIW